jgi:predicted dehydrogenase
MSKNVGVVVVGLGAIGLEHAAIYRDLPGSTQVGVVDPRLQQDAVPRAWGDMRLYGSLAAALEDGDIDAVSLCTPDHLHFEDAKLVMAANCHLLLEKPVATDTGQVRELTKLAEEANTVVLPGHTLRFESRYHWARQMVSSGVIGEVVHGYVRRNNKVSVAARAGGRVPVSYFLGVHDVDALQWITGKNVQWVQAAATSLPDASGEQSAAVMATLGLDGGAVVQLEAAWALPENYPSDLDARFRLVGTRSEVSIDSFDSGAHLAGATYGLPMTGGLPLYGRVQGPLREELAHFVDCCSAGTTPAISVREAGQAVFVIDAIERAVVSGTRESVEIL